MTPPHDVAILGGGPAGTAAARLLATWGHRVILLTRPPHHRPLAESLPPSITRVLDRLGVREAVDRAGFLRSSGNTAWWGAAGGEGHAGAFAGGELGYQVPRARFDQLLLDQAAAAGAVIHRQAIVRRVERHGEEHRRVEYDADAATRTVTARWVIDCTGRAGLTARQGGRRVEAGPRTTALVATWEQPNWPVPDISHTLIESLDGGWAWSVPESSSRRQVAVMLDPSVTPLDGAAGLLAQYQAELARTRQLGAMLDRAWLVEPPWARDASPYRSSATGEPGLLLAGDTASFADPLSSFGVKKALVSGWLAAVVVRTALDDPAMTDAALAFQARRERDMAAALHQGGQEFSRDATGAHGGAYWARRLAGEEAAIEGDPDVAALRHDPAVLAAFGTLRMREALRVRPGPSLRQVERPAIAADRVVMETQLVLPAFPGGIRWLRGVDLVALAERAPASDDVGKLYDGFPRPYGEVPLPDFLGALAVLLAHGALEFA